MLIRVGTLLSSSVATGEGGAALSLAALLAAGEDEALAFSFLDSTFLSTTGFAGSAFVKHIATPANDYDNSLDTSAASLLAYTSPSPKRGMQADGEHKYFAHNLLPYSEDLTQWLNWAGTPVKTATTLEDDNAGSSEIAYYPLSSTVSGATYAVKFAVLKDAVTSRAVRLSLESSSGTAYIRMALNTSTGAHAQVATANGGTYSVEDGGTEWLVKCTLPINSTDTFVQIMPAYGPDINTASVATLGTVTINRVYAFRAPANEAYLKTTGAARCALPIEFDSNGDPLGLLIETARTNLFLNSATGATQNCTVTAQPYTISFWGTGTITLSGVSSAGPLVGTGASNRVTLTFTPTAGTLTLTVSGTCSNVQLEAGGAATSHIETFGSTTTRATDNIRLNTTAFNVGTSRTIFVEAALNEGSQELFALMGASGFAEGDFYYDGSNFLVSVNRTANTINANMTAAWTAVGTHKFAQALATNDTALVFDGGAPSTDNTITVCTPTHMRLQGGDYGTANKNRHLRTLMILPRRMSNADMQTLTGA